MGFIRFVYYIVISSFLLCGLNIFINFPMTKTKVYYRTIIHSLVTKNQTFFPSSKRSKIPRWVLRHLIVDDNLKILFCVLPKVSSTRWKMLAHAAKFTMIADPKCYNASYDRLKEEAIEKSTTCRNEFIEIFNNPILKNEKFVHDYQYLNYLSKLFKEGIEIKEFEERFKSYTKIMITRNPYERLLSAYLDKFSKYNKHFAKTYNAIIYAKTHDLEMRKENGHVPSNYTPTFNDFINFIIRDDVKSPSSPYYNNHWAPISQICSLKLIKYDFIGRFEKLKTQGPQLAEIFFMPPSKTGIIANKENRRNPRTKMKLSKDDFAVSIFNFTSSTTNLTSSFFRNLSHLQLQKINMIYEHDFDIFGYSRMDIINRN